tara:strand:- start:246 stop:782 length:537 start_codon:yes stop_codon:yes gene_type:complete
MEKQFKPLKEISVENAKEYISLIDDSQNNYIHYYTLEPSIYLDYPGSEGWEDVTYYTNRRKPKIKINGEEIITEEGYIQVGDGPNIVYIMSNPIHDLLKIGSTRKDVEERRKELSSSSGVPLPFKVEWILRLEGNELQLENEIHRYLECRRSNMNREFFDINLNQAIEAVLKVAKKYI